MTDAYKTFFNVDNKNKNVEKTVKKNWSNDLLKILESNGEFNVTNIAKPYLHPLINVAIKKIAENFPQAKYKIYDRNNKEVIPSNPISNLFLNPNPYMSRFEMWESIASFLNYKGEAFIYVNNSVGGRAGLGTIPAELWPLNPDLVRHSVQNGKVIGWIYNGSMPIEPEEMIHFKLFNPDPYSIRGLSPIQVAKFELEADYSASKWNKYFFDNNATPDGVVEIDKDASITVEDLRKLQRLWNENQQGVNKHGKTAFMLGGMKYNPIGISQKDMDFIQGRKFSREIILSIYGVSPFVAGYYSDGTVTRATAKEAKRLFWKGTLKPQLTRIEEKLNTNFFPKFAPQYYGRFDLSDVEELQDDYLDKLEKAKRAFDLGWNMNQVNERYDLGLPESEFNGYRPFNVERIELNGSINTAPSTGKSIKPKKNVEKSIEKQRNSTFHRRFLQLQEHMEGKLYPKIKRYFYDKRKEVLSILSSEKEFDIELAEKIAQIREIFESGKDDLIKLVQPIYQETAQASGEMALENLAFDKPFIINQSILNERLNLIKGVNDTIFDSLKTSINQGIQDGETINDISKRIKDIFNTTSNKARQIARTETASLMNKQVNQTYADEGVKEIEWIAEADARESHQINGEIIPVGGTFSNGLQYPGDENAGPEEVVNCRCSIGAVIR